MSAANTTTVGGLAKQLESVSCYILQVYQLFYQYS